MRKFKALVVLNLKAMLNSVRFGGKKKKARAATGIGTIVFIGFLALYLSGIYSFLFASQFAPIGMVHLVIMMMAVLAVVMGLMFTVFAAQGIIFGGRDNDLMLALPIPAFTLLLARTIALYVENLVFSFFIMAPAGVAYLVFGGAGGVGFLIKLLLATLFLALLPTVLALLVGFLLAWMTSKFGRRALVSNVLYCGAFVLLMVFIFQLNFSVQTITVSAAMGIEQGFSVWGVPFMLLVEGVCQGNFLSLILFIALCLVPFLLVVWFFAGRYKKLVTNLGAKSARSDYKLGTVAAADSRRALLSKESKRFFGTPIYLFNTGVGLVMMVAGGVAALFFKGTIEEFLHQMGEFAAALPIMPLLCVTVAFMVTMTAVTASSISLEGKQLWILKEAPVPVEHIFGAKVGFQLLIELPCVLACTVCLAFAFSLPVLEWLVFFLVGGVLSVFCALFGLYVNLCMPKLDAANDTMVVKNSGAAMVGVFVPMLIALVLGVLWFFLHGVIGSNPAMLVCVALLVLGCVLMLRLLNTKGKAIWLEL